MSATVPTITGTVSGQTTTFETPIDPFSDVTIGDASAGATDTLAIILSGPPQTLSGTGLSGGGGLYTLTGTAAEITSELRAVSFTPVDGVSNTSVTTEFTLSLRSSAYGADTYDSPLSTLATFIAANGAEPEKGLTFDAAGDLFGTTVSGGADNDGAVFEIAKSTGELTTLASFTGANGDGPDGLTIDAAGDLFGTTISGGADTYGTVFEIAKASGELTTLATFTSANGSGPSGDLAIDAAGDLFGTTVGGGVNGDGTVFEIAKSTGELTTLATFNGSNGATPEGGLTIDAAGDLIGTTNAGGADNDGTVFEIAKSNGELTTLASFTGATGNANGTGPAGGLTIDAAGDLFGTTSGGPYGDGTVFEIPKSTGKLTTLASFTGADGAKSYGDLTVDAAGNLFGTTLSGGADNDGTVFEIAKSTGALTTLATFNAVNGSGPAGGLTLDAAGDLVGTTSAGGADNDGTVYELPGTFVPIYVSDDTTTVTDINPGSEIIWQNMSTGQASVWGMEGTTRIGGGVVSVNPGPSWKAVGTGDFFIGYTSDILWQNTSTGQISVWAMDGNTRASGGALSLNPGPAWQAIGTGDFDGNGNYEILLQDASTGQASIWEMDEKTRTGGGVVSVNPGTSWKAVGTGDFYGNGDDDILWQNESTGQVSIWEMNGNTRTGGGAVSLNPGTSWKAIGTGDFTGVGLNDILFQNTSTGQVSIWEMNGTTRTGGGAVSLNPGPSWHAIGTDGGSDILFQNTSGQVAIWDMDGTIRTGGGTVSLNPGTSWHAVSLT